MVLASSYTCTVHFHWLGLHLFARSNLLPSIGVVERVVEHVFVVQEEGGNHRIDPSGMTKFEIKVRATSKVDAPLPGNHEFIDGDVARLAMGMAMVRAASSPESVVGDGVRNSSGKEIFTRALRPFGGGWGGGGHAVQFCRVSH